jgi:hypothetical protein
MKFAISTQRRQNIPRSCGMKGNFILLLMIGFSTVVHMQILRLFQQQSAAVINGRFRPGFEEFVKSDKQQLSSQNRSAAATIGDNAVSSSPPPNRPHRKWAYAFLMAGVDVRFPSYKGIFYNVLVSAEILKDSKADIIVMVQMSRRSQSSKLTDEEESHLRSMNVKIHYLDVPKEQNFYQIQFEKFRILDFYTNYTRVIYMDGDVMPYCSLDYMFELSEPEDQTAKAPLKGNVILTWSQEPSHGGFFMLQPKEGDFDLVQAIIKRREKEAVESGVLFDLEKGWGHVITPPDHVSACIQNYPDHDIVFLTCKSIRFL